MGRPDSGVILIDGLPLSDDNADAWRASIRWMPQAPHFLNGSLRSNIGFGDAISGDTLGPLDWTV